VLAARLRPGLRRRPARLADGCWRHSWPLAGLTPPVRPATDDGDHV